MACVFCSIVGGAPAAVVYRSPGVVAFLDARPVFKGHTLVVPATHVESFGELAPAAVPELFAAVQRIAGAVERGLGADGTFVAINNRVSQSVPHLHVHVVPRNRKDGLRGFFWPRQKYASEEEMEACAAAIRAALPSPQ